MVKLYDRNFREEDVEDVEDVESGDIIVFPSLKDDCINYFIVNKVKNDMIHGHIVYTYGARSVSVKDIASACNL